MLNLDQLIISKFLNKEQHHYILEKGSRLEKSLNESFDIDNQSVTHQIYKYYNQSHRHYHNLSHIYNLFKLNDCLSTDYREIVEVAIWFHDVIYQPFYKNNEARSRDFFIKILSKNTSHQFKRNEIEWVEGAIMSTFGHYPRSKNDGIELFLDMDLSILASNWKTYQRYTEGVRKEYWIYPNALYKKGRIKVLKHFLERESIFYTPIFKEKEGLARANLRREIKLLE
ncbi:MAG: hypothetical protein ACPG19_09315 [Saprospiraceae bacterium]